jgi:hypothetical protein
MKTKRKVGKKEREDLCEGSSIGCGDYACRYNTKGLCEKRKPQSEVKNCENCFYQGTDGHKADTRLPCLDCCLADDHNKHLEWKPRQEEVEVTIGFINEGNYDFEVMCSDNDRLRELIPKGSTLKFKLIPVEGK